MQDTVAAAKSNDQAKLADLTSSMALPPPNEWFLSVFGTEWGNVYARLYADNSGKAAKGLVSFFSALAAQKISVDTVQQFKNSCDFTADQDEYPMLAARISAEPFTLVRFGKGTSERALRFIAFVGGGFRYLGLLRVPATMHGDGANMLGSAAETNPGSKPRRIFLDVMEGKAIHRAPPEYPVIARQNHIEGTVIIRVLIGPDGSVGNLHVVQGQCLLAKAALAAAKQWRFAPTVLNGSAVEVETNLEFNFNLASP